VGTFRNLKNWCKTATPLSPDIALDAMLEASCPDEDTIAAIVRNRIELEDSEKVEEQLFKNAATNLALLSSYPADEAAWLVTTSFNR